MFSCIIAKRAGFEDLVHIIRTSHDIQHKYTRKRNELQSKQHQCVPG